MAGVNVAGISKVFGDEAKLKSCELHFKDCRNKEGQKLESESSDEFKELCDRLLLCTAVAGYQATDSRAFRTSWASWWHEHHGFIFRAFTNHTAPQMNQAEVIHAGWAHPDR